MANKSGRPKRHYTIRGAKTKRKVKIYFPRNGTRSKTKPGFRFIDGALKDKG